MPQAAVETTPQLPPRVDPALLEALQAAAADCTSAAGQLTCNGGKKNALTLAFNRGDRKKTAALATFAHALSSGDEKLRALSAAVLYGAFRLDLDSGKESAQKADVDPKDAKELLATALALSAQSAIQATPAAVHAVMLTGQSQEVRAALKQDLPIQVRTMALRYLMVYGRLALFDEVKAASLEPGTAVVLSAVESPRNMKNWSTEEKAEICPWLVGFLQDARGPVVGNALAGLPNCRAEEIALLLETVGGSLRDKQFSFIHSAALRNLCGRAKDIQVTEATESHCRIVRDLEERASSTEGLAPRVRTMTLSNAAYDWPDERSFALAKKLAKSKEPEIQKAAKQIQQRLEQQLAR